jgi:uncharacterized membrane protein YkvA (DUF1232 family)
MGQQPNSSPKHGTITQIAHTFQLVWRLLNDSRVPILNKLIVPAVIAYVVWPIDLIPDAIPILGQLDDVGVVFFGIRFFIETCPEDVVMEHRRAIAGETNRGRGDYVDATYRVVDEDRRK